MTEQKETKNNPEQPKKPETQAAVEAGKPGSTDSQLDKDFGKRIDSKAEAYEKKLNELHKKFKSQGSVGEKKADVIIGRQINRINEKAAEKKAAFKQLMADEKAKRMELILGETETEMHEIYFPIEKIIDYVRGLDQLDDAELVRIEAILEAIRKMKTNPEAEQLFLKVLGQKEQLTAQDYRKIINLLNPAPLAKAIQDRQNEVIFETSQAGAIIGIMTPKQKYELIEEMTKVLTPADLNQILEIMLTTGVITNIQIDDLVKKNKLPVGTAEALKKKIDQGEIAKKQQEYQKKMIDLTNLNKGKTANNVFNKTVGGPALFAIMGLWGAATALVNFKIDFDINHPLESSADALAKPWTLAGLAAMGGSVMGLAPIVAPEKYGQAKESVVEFFSGPEKKAQNIEAKKVEMRQMLEYRLTRNHYLLEYLATQDKFADGAEKTGLEVINEIVAEYQKKQKNPEFKFTEIMQKSSPKQREILQKAYGLEGSTDINFSDTVKGVMGLLAGLDLNQKDKFLTYHKELRTKQGVNA